MWMDGKFTPPDPAVYAEMVSGWRRDMASPIPARAIIF